MRLPIRFLVLSLALLASGCDTGLGEAQRVFEDQAFLGAAEGITEVRIVDGEAVVIDTDPDDWRVGPSFGTRVQVLSAPSPNPVSRGGAITFTLFTTDPGQLQLRRRDARGDVLFVDAFPSSAGGIRSLTVFGSDLDDGTDGIFRIVVTDDRESVVTYGDVRVEG